MTGRLRLLLVACTIVFGGVVALASIAAARAETTGKTTGEALEAARAGDTVLLPPKRHYVWYPTNTGPITGQHSETSDPCHDVFGVVGAGTTVTWNGSSGTCSGSEACPFPPGCGDDIVGGLRASTDSSSNSTIEILDEEKFLKLLARLGHR